MPTDKPNTSRRSALSRTLVTTEVLDTSTRLFAEKGYASTSLADIAQALGISRPALYHYLSSKEDLLVMLVAQVSQGFAEVLEQLTARDDLSPTEKLTNVVEIIVRQRAEHPDQFRILDRSELMLPEPARTEHLAAKRRILHEVTAMIEAGIHAGEFRPVEPRTAALSLLGMCNWVAWWFPRRGDVTSVVATLIDLNRAMLLADGAATPARDTGTTITRIRELLDELDPKA